MRSEWLALIPRRGHGLDLTAKLSGVMGRALFYVCASESESVTRQGTLLESAPVAWACVPSEATAHPTLPDIISA